MLIVVIAGPSGAGKGSIAAALLERDRRLWLSRSWTTRPPRPGEPRNAYHFVDDATFRLRVAEDGFVEHAEVFGHLYGTPTLDAPPGRDVLLEIDVQGAEQVKRRHPEALVLFVRAPSREAQEARLRARGDAAASIARRLAEADAEEAAGLRLADHVVVNDDLPRAVDEVAGILEQRRSEGSARSGPRPGET